MGFTDYKIRYAIDGDTKGLQQELLKGEGLLSKFGVGGASSFASLGGAASIAAGGVAAAGGAVVSAGVALFNITKQAADYGSTIFDASKKTGLHAESLSAMDFAAKQSGTSLEAITGGIAKYAKTVGEAADGSDKAAAKLKAFGIDPKEAIDDLDGSLAKVFKRIQDAPPGIERMTLAQKAFGKSGADLLPFIDSFDGDLAGLIRKAKALGVTINDDTAAAADRFGDSLDTLDAQLNAVKVTIGNQLMPVFNEMADDISGWLVANQDEVRKWGETFASVLRSVSSGIKKEMDDITGLVEFIDEVGTQLKSGDSWLFDWQKYHDRVNLRKEQGGFNDAMARFESENSRYQREMSRYEANMAKLKRKGHGYGSLDDEDGAGTGKVKKPPKENDSDFRRFFNERGFDVTRTFGKEINEGSLHTSGLAADVRTRGKKIEDIFALTAAALEKGYRLFDERVKRDGVKQTGPHQHYERGGSLKASGFLGAEFYGGADQLAYLKQLDAERLGKASGTAGFKRFRKEQIDGTKKTTEENLSVIHDGINRELELYESAAKTRLEWLDYYVAAGITTESEAAVERKEIEDSVIQNQIKKLQEYSDIATVSEKERVDITQKIALLWDQASQSQAKYLTAQKKAWDEWEKDRLDRWGQAVKDLREIQDAQINPNIEGDARPGIVPKDYHAKDRQRMIQTTVGSGGEISAIGQLQDYFVGEGNTAAIAGVDALSGAFSQLGQAIGETVNAWVLYGSAGQSVRQVTAQILAGIAQQATVKAIFELAEGFAALAMAFFGVPNAGPSATAHFTAAAIYGGIAGIAAVAGRAVAGDSMKGGGGSAGGGKSGNSSASDVVNGDGRHHNYEDLRPYSRSSEDAFISGYRSPELHALARAVAKLENKLGSMSPGDVLTRGAAQRRGFIGKTVVNEIKSNSAIGTQMLKRSGMK
jgi:hypothetical protein